MITCTGTYPYRQYVHHNPNLIAINQFALLSADETELFLEVDQGVNTLGLQPRDSEVLSSGISINKLQSRFL